MSRRVAYAAIVVFVTMVGLFVSSVVYTNHVDERRERSDRQQEQAQRQQGEQTRAVVCRLIVAQVDAYADQPAQTSVGRNVAATWAELKLQLGC